MAGPARLNRQAGHDVGHGTGVTRLVILGCLIGWAAWGAGLAQAADLGLAFPGRAIPVQVPFEMPPKPPEVPSTTVPPSDKPLSPEEVKRAEALLPLLSGKQEFYAIGEFVHLGPPVVPVLVRALKMPDPRIRYNAIETLGIIKDSAAAPALIESAMEPNEMPRVREHALKMAVRLDPAQAPKAIKAMGQDSNSTIRKAAAFQSRYVRDKAIVPVLIALLSDPEQYVAITAVQSLWILTRHPTEMHDWESSTQDDRKSWAQEWNTWWEGSQNTFEFPDPTRPRKPL